MLFANLLSVQNGLARCYWTDESFTTPVDSSNYQNGPFYCDWDANGYRLLTEGEWEYCCRAGTTTPFWRNEPNFDGADCESCEAGLLANLEMVAYFCANDNGDLAPVASRPANAWGFFDMHGNALEWCWDHYGNYPSGDVTDYAGPASGSERVFRGGGFFSKPHALRSARRDGAGANYHYFNLGFRLARTLP